MVRQVADEPHPLIWPKPWLLDVFLPRLLTVIQTGRDPGPPPERVREIREVGPADFGPTAGGSKT
jgi:hypothetical protein